MMKVKVPTERVDIVNSAFEKWEEKMRALPPLPQPKSSDRSSFGEFLSLSLQNNFRFRFHNAQRVYRKRSERDPGRERKREKLCKPPGVVS